MTDIPVLKIGDCDKAEDKSKVNAICLVRRKNIFIQLNVYALQKKFFFLKKTGLRKNG